jgi:hypothetical protein
MISTDFLNTRWMFTKRLSDRKIIGYGISIAVEPVEPVEPVSPLAR